MGPLDLRDRRKALQLSQTDLGRAMGVTRNTIARWERGELEMRHSDLVELALERLEAGSARTADSVRIEPRSGLPAEWRSFVGRDQELGEMRRALQTTRLLTLTGTGGVGKTRLAVRFAHEEQREYPDGGWFVDLARITDPTSIARAVAAAVQLGEGPGPDPAAKLAAVVSGQRALLVLDNCEHLLEPCARFVAAMLHNTDAWMACRWHSSSPRPD